jgi:prefoldin subunit 5
MTSASPAAPVGFRAQLGWMVRGRRQTVGALYALSNDLRSLQQQVASLETAVHELQRAQRDLDARQLDELDRLRVAVAAATDDLTARVTATQAQVRALA